MRHTLLHALSLLVHNWNQLTCSAEGESLISINVRRWWWWLPLDLTSRFVHMNESEWMNRMEMKLRWREEKSLSEREKLLRYYTHTSCFCIQIMFYAELWFHTDIHSWWTMNFSFFPISPPPLLSSHSEDDECRDWICVLSVFQNISTWMPHFIFRISHASHIAFQK